MIQVEDKVVYNGHAKCYSTLTMTYEEARRYSLDNGLYIRCQHPSGMKWWYFAYGKEVDSDTFFNN